jgi:hypothetical protein
MSTVDLKEVTVDSNAPKAGWDLFLFGVPLIALLIFGFFRLDEVFTARKSGDRDRRPSLVPERGKSFIGTDPDGRSWDEPDSPGK